MEQSTFDNFFDKYLYPVSTWVLLAMQIICGAITIFQIWEWNKFLIFVFLFMSVLIYATRVFFDGYRWKRYVDADTGNRWIRRLKKKLYKRAKRNVARSENRKLKK